MYLSLCFSPQLIISVRFLSVGEGVNFLAMPGCAHSENWDSRNERRRKEKLQGFQTHMIVSAQKADSIQGCGGERLSRRMLLIESRMLSAFVYVGENDHMHVLTTVWQILRRDH